MDEEFERLEARAGFGSHGVSPERTDPACYEIGQVDVEITAVAPQDALSLTNTIASVWAPSAAHVAIEIGGVRSPLEAIPGGWWRSKAGVLAHGVRYGFFIDDSGPLPDPRSPFQPEGVEGRSEHVDHSRFRWTDHHFQAKPLGSGLLYEIHLGTFTPEGTGDAAIARLDDLVELGVTHIELMPVAAFDGSRGWGYDGVALFAPHTGYGGPDGVKRLVDACHARGLGVILDVVYNHLGPKGNVLPQFGPYFTDRHHTPWGKALNFDGPESGEVRRFVLDNALMWFKDYHFDGLRLDAVHAIIDLSAVHILEELARSVEEWSCHLGRHLFLIAESDLNDPRIIQAREIGGYGITAQWCDDTHHAVHAALTGERHGYYRDFGTLDHLALALRRPFVYAGERSPHRGRVHGRLPGNVSGDRFVACLQNHDQLGNRATGERFHHLVGPEIAKIGAALILLSPYVPMIFQGEEWGASSPFLYFVDFADPELAAAVRDGRRSEFNLAHADLPDPNALTTFERSKLNWGERTSTECQEMRRWYLQLIRLRRTFPELSNGRLDLVQTAFDEEKNWLLIERAPIVVAVNLADTSRRIPGQWSHAQILLASSSGVSLSPDALVVPSHTVAILRRDPEIK